MRNAKWIAFLLFAAQALTDVNKTTEKQTIYQSNQTINPFRAVYSKDNEEVLARCGQRFEGSLH
jgi:hypothetical protein